MAKFEHTLASLNAWATVGADDLHVEFRNRRLTPELMAHMERRLEAHIREVWDGGLLLDLRADRAGDLHIKVRFDWDGE